MPRAQNAHAIVNAGFLCKFDEKYRAIERPNIIFGGINPNFVSFLKSSIELGKK